MTDVEISQNAKVKTKYIYSSSTSAEPYAKTNYSYDHNWNLIKELNIDLPNTATSSYTYQYDSQGRLINKKYNFKSGLNHSGQTEAVLSVIREYKYQYIDDLQIELIYKKGELYDSVIYKNYGKFVLEEHHFNQSRGTEWSILNEYDSDGNLIKTTIIPENSVTAYEYEDSKLVKIIGYNADGNKSSECEFTYSRSGSKMIRENCGDKVTYVNGNFIEYIMYHPTFPGSEWWCYRYEYY